MKFTVLGSGSTGNALLITAGKTKVLIDAGLSAREIARRMALQGEDITSLDGVIITHEHSDHVGGLRVLLNLVKCPVFISGETHEAYLGESFYSSTEEPQKRSAACKDRTVEIGSGKDFRIGEIDFHPFTVPHDAADNMGFVAEYHGVRIASLTDFGHFTKLMKEKLRHCDAIMIESNHSLDMLRACPHYTWSLKQRIASRHGHLSNEDLADWIENDFDGAAQHLILMHLSQKANEPNLARLTAEMALKSKSRNSLFPPETEVVLTNAKEPTRWFEF
jgi:phosphoribosyl 1,2-cyclic phosphodiesterase